jgi:hypothetical protein
MLNRFFYALTGLSFSLFLTSCGQPVCVMGIGQCAAPDKTPTTTSGSLSVNSDSSTIYYSSSASTPNTATLTISGGTSPYTLTINSNTTSYAYFLNGSGNQVSSIPGITSTVTVYASQSGPAQNVLITVNDSSSPPNYGSVTITVSP